MDSLPLKPYDNSLNDICLEFQKEMNEMKATIDGLYDCLKTSEDIISHLSEAIVTNVEVIKTNIDVISLSDPWIGHQMTQMADEIQREEHDLETKKSSLIDANVGHNVDHLIHSWQRFVSTRGKESAERTNVMNDKCIQTDETIAEDIDYVDYNAIDCSQMIATEATDRETFFNITIDGLSDINDLCATDIEAESEDIDGRRDGNTSETIGEDICLTSDDGNDESIAIKTTNCETVIADTSDAIDSEATDIDEYADDENDVTAQTEIDGTNGVDLMANKSPVIGANIGSMCPESGFTTAYCNFISAKSDECLATNETTNGNQTLEATDGHSDGRQTHSKSVANKMTTNKGRPKRQTLRGFKRVVNTVRPCQCPVCVFAIKYRHNLVRHMKTHKTMDAIPLVLNVSDGQSPVSGQYACDWPECAYITTNSGNLIGHKNAKHLNVQPFVCNWSGCGFRSSYPGAYSGHTFIMHVDPRLEPNTRSRDALVHSNTG